MDESPLDCLVRHESIHFLNFQQVSLRKRKIILIKQIFRKIRQRFFSNFNMGRSQATITPAALPSIAISRQ